MSSEVASPDCVSPSSDVSLPASPSSNDDHLNFLFAYLCKEHGEETSSQFQKYCKTKCDGLLKENAELVASNNALAAKVERLRAQIAMQNAIIANHQSPDKVRPSESMHAVPSPPLLSSKAVSPPPPPSKVVLAPSLLRNKAGQTPPISPPQINLDSIMARLSEMEKEFNDLREECAAAKQEMKDAIAKTDSDVAENKRDIESLENRVKSFDSVIRPLPKPRTVPFQDDGALLRENLRSRS